METLEALGLTTGEALQAMHINTDSLLGIVQLWISVTFAVVIAYFFAGPRMTLQISRFLRALYGGFSLLAVLVGYSATGGWLFWADVAELPNIAAGMMSPEAHTVQSTIRSIVGWGAIFMLLAGSIATLYFLPKITHMKSEKQTD